MTQGGPLDGCGISLFEGATTLGRDPSNDIVVEHPAVSRNHAQIIARSEGYWLEDLESLNGTFIDGERAEPGRRRLADGERIQFGTTAAGTVWVFREVLFSNPRETIEAPTVSTATPEPAPATRRPPDGRPAYRGAPSRPARRVQRRSVSRSVSPRAPRATGTGAGMALVQLFPEKYRRVLDMYVDGVPQDPPRE